MNTAGFRVNHGAVESEVIEGEAVVVNMETGKYFCLNTTGATIWQWLDRGARSDDIVATLASAFGIDPSGLRKGVDAFLEALRREGMVIPFEVAGGALPMPSGGLGATFVEPQLETYTDMQEFLLVDPVHEIDEKSIPQKPKD